MPQRGGIGGSRDRVGWCQRCRHGPNPTRVILDRWAVRTKKPKVEPEGISEDYLPNKSWEEMDETEGLIGNTCRHKPVGDDWRHKSEAPQRTLGREMPGMDLPGL